MGKPPQPFSKESFIDPLGLFKSGKPTASPIASAPVPEASPPVSPFAPEVMQAGQDLRQQTMLKKSIKNTIFAGDDGGWKPSGMVKPAGGNPFVPPQGRF